MSPFKTNEELADDLLEIVLQFIPDKQEKKLAESVSLQIKKEKSTREYLQYLSNILFIGLHQPEIKK